MLRVYGTRAPERATRGPPYVSHVWVIIRSPRARLERVRVAACGRACPPRRQEGRPPIALAVPTTASTTGRTIGAKGKRAPAKQITSAPRGRLRQLRPGTYRAMSRNELRVAWFAGMLFG